MADNDYRELIDFLGRKFEKVDEQFEKVGKQFEEIDRQFKGVYERLDNTATKDDLARFATKDDLVNFATKDDLTKFVTRDEFKAEITASKEEVMRHTGVLIEAVYDKLDLLVEGRAGTHERMERDKEENGREHGRLEKMSLINTADISTLDERVGRLEGKV